MSVDFGEDAQLARDLMRDEGRNGEDLPAGFVHVAYPDPLSPLGKWLAHDPSRKLFPAQWPAHLSGDPWTIGFGHTGREVLRGLVWTNTQALEALAADIARHNALLAHAIPWVSGLDPVRRRVLQNMVFNMGWDDPRTPKLEGLSGFTTFLGLVKAGQYVTAAKDGRGTLWARETGDRAARLMAELETGRYPVGASV